MAIPDHYYRLPSSSISKSFVQILIPKDQLPFILVFYLSSSFSYFLGELRSSKCSSFQSAKVLWINCHLISWYLNISSSFSTFLGKLWSSECLYKDSVVLTLTLMIELQYLKLLHYNYLPLTYKLSNAPYVSMIFVSNIWPCGSCRYVWKLVDTRPVAMFTQQQG